MRSVRSFSVVRDLFVVVLWSCVACSAIGEYVKVEQLNSNWILTNGTKILSPITLPSGIYSALYGEDILKSYNDIKLRSVSYDDWTYSKKFSFPVSELNGMLVNLTFHGIDTVAEIRLNHELLGRTDNMFVRYSYDITELLQEENDLEVEIKSPVKAALELANALDAQNATVPPKCPPQSYNGECHMNMLRKMQASFGWDWGLAAPSIGIWKSVALEVYKVAVLRDVDVVFSKNDTHWTMHVTVFMDAGGEKDFYANLKLYSVEILDEAVEILDYTEEAINYRDPVIKFDVGVPISRVELWWPNGYGDAKLYPLFFTLNAYLSKEGPSYRDKTISSKSIQVGFRTIELVEEKVTEGEGYTFLFKVNGAEIFMKGTNYIPSHILPELAQDESRIRFLLTAVKDANMNMIRIWGGGIYESDYFYNLADSLGILIWQDMMFACAMYSVTPDFLASVRVEVSQNIKRIAHHASIAIFAANNENEVALVQNWYGTIGDKSRFEAEYRELYLANVLHELKLIQHSSRPNPLVSSPSNGREGENYNYISPDPQNNHYGDVHFYTEFKDGWNANIFPRPRFSSEYGFQSLPAESTWAHTMSSEDNILDLINHRQHHTLGMQLIIDLIRRHLPLPLPEDANYVEALLYFSQIAQAMATKVETELYRSLRDTEHRTMGALYWQLNDVWVAPSWSSIDFDGNYKILHHWAQDFMAPVSIIALYDDAKETVNVSLTCDYLSIDAEDLEVTANIYLWSDLNPKNSTKWPATLKANGVQYDKVIPVRDIFVGLFTKTNSFVEFVLSNNSQTLSKTYYFPTSLREAVGIADPEIDVEPSFHNCDEEISPKLNSYSLTVSTKKPAIFVFIEINHKSIGRYKMSRNGFMMVTPVQIVHLEFESDECLDITRSHIRLLTVNRYMI